MNAYRLVADGFHMLAILILFVKFFSKSSTKGVSGKTQFLFTMVFCLRYLDMATNFVSLYNSVAKVYFIMGSLVAVIVVYGFFRENSDSKNDTFRIEILLVPVTLLALYVNHEFTVLELCWTWSIYMEVVALIPQFYMALRGGHVDMYIVSYVTSLVLYRGFYIVNWYYRYNTEQYFDMIVSISGVVQAVIGFLGLVLLLSNYWGCCCFSNESSGRNKHPSIYTLPFVTQGFPRDYNLIRSEKSMKNMLNNGPYSHDLSVPILQEEENA